MLVLGRAEVESLGLGMPEVLRIVESALAEKAAGRVELPPKLGISPRPGAVLHAMPARLGEAAGMKWIASYPANRARGLPPTSALIVLNDAETGLPQALLEGSLITTLRTGAIAGAAARRLARPDAKVAAILGPGAIGGAALEALRLALPGLREVRAWAPRIASAERFAARLGAIAAASAREAIRGADIVVTSAPWPGGPPHLEPDWIAPGAFVCALDYDVTLKEEAAAICDVRAADDVPQLELARTKGSFQGWPPFSELCTARREDPRQRTLCAALGMAILDVGVAHRAVQLARERRIGSELAIMPAVSER